MGNVVHLAIERIVRSLVQTNCRSLSDPQAAVVIRELGGFTSIIHASIDEIVKLQSDNPRAPDSSGLRVFLENSISRMRADIQRLLRTVPLVAATKPIARASRSDDRTPLVPGVYPELEVRAPELGWRGIIDLLVLQPPGCEIRDFKTGRLSEEHEFQVRVYAALWSADRELNPLGTLATRLTITYPQGDVAVPAPTANEVLALTEELRQRAADARQSAETRPPEARPSLDECGRCGVRHLCSEYWNADTRRRLAADSDTPPRLDDLEVRVLSRRGPVTWEAVTQQSDHLRIGEPLVILARGGQHTIEPGAVLRILDARILPSIPHDSDESPDLPIASLTSMSEVYLLT